MFSIPTHPWALPEESELAKAPVCHKLKLWSEKDGKLEGDLELRFWLQGWPGSRSQ